MTSPAAAHSVDSSEWYTPRDIVEAAREFLGGIDTDPASCEAAQSIVAARTWYDAERDGLAHLWTGRVFLNPPSPPRPWALRLGASIRAGFVDRAVFVGYSIETLSQYQNWPGFAPSIVCAPRTRPRYLRQVDGAIVAGASPAHASVVFGLGGDAERFARAFRSIGECFVPLSKD